MGSVDTEDITTVSNGMGSQDGSSDDNTILIVAAAGGGVVVVLLVVALFLCRGQKVESNVSVARTQNNSPTSRAFMKNEMMKHILLVLVMTITHTTSCKSPVLFICLCMCVCVFAWFPCMCV